MLFLARCGQTPSIHHKQRRISPENKPLSPEKQSPRRGSNPHPSHPMTGAIPLRHRCHTGGGVLGRSSWLITRGCGVFHTLEPIPMYITPGWDILNIPSSCVKLTWVCFTQVSCSLCAPHSRGVIYIETALTVYITPGCETHGSF